MVSMATHLFFFKLFLFDLTMMITMNFERSLGRIFFLIIIRALTTRRVAVCDEFYRVLPSFFFVCFASIFLPFLLRRPLSRYFLFRVLHFFFFFFWQNKKKKKKKKREKKLGTKKKPGNPSKKSKKKSHLP